MRFRPVDTLQELAARLAQGGDDEALVSFQAKRVVAWRRRELASAVDAAAGRLAGHGVGAGDAVALSAGNGTAWIVAALATLRLGGVLVPLDSHFAEATFRHAITDSGARLLLADAGAAKRFAQVCDGAGIAVIDIASWGEPGAGDRPVEAPPPSAPAVGSSDRALLFYTSGTTGPPKGVPLTHGNVVHQLATLAAADLVKAGDRVLLPLPFHHVYPFVIGVLTPIALGVPIILPDGFTGTRIVEALRQGGATIIIGVPRLYEAMVEGLQERAARRGRIAGAALKALIAASTAARRRFGLRLGKTLLRPVHASLGPRLDVVVSGGAALKPELAFALEGLGWKVGTGYGLTETSPLLTLNAPGRGRLETAGRPIRDTEIRIGPAEAAEGVDPSLGEVEARGPGVFAGYHNLPDETKKAFTADGWFRTGDLGRIDGDGSLFVAGRGSTLIVTASGKNIQPDEVEEAYARHPAIAEIAVFDKGGELAALIVASDAVRRDADREAAVRAGVREVSAKLPSYMRLSQFAVTVEAIPRTRLGKPRRHLIAERYERARAGVDKAAPGEAAPLALDELAGDDRALLDNEAALAAFELLVERAPGRRVTPDSDLRLDLGIDSIDWLDLTLEIAERAGVALSEEAVGDMETVRDLLTALTAGGGGAEALGRPLDDAEAALSPRQRQWLNEPGPFMRALGRALHAIDRALMRVFRLEARGLENVPDGPCVLAPNHASYLDPFALAACLDFATLRRTYWAGWAGVVFAGPVRRAFARVARAVPIEPRRAAASSLAFGAAALERDCSLVWFPEGERSGDGRLLRFRPGLGILLARHRVPVVPVIIRGTHRAWPVARRLPRPAPIAVDILPALDPAQLATEGRGDSDAERITDALHTRMAGHLGEGGSDGEPRRRPVASEGEANRQRYIKI